MPKLLIRRDPRDISRAWVLEPETKHYLEIPYRIPSHQALTLWEQRHALARLRQKGRDQVDLAAYPKIHYDFLWENDNQFMQHCQATTELTIPKIYRYFSPPA